jgi:hypothetical protein
MMQQAIWLDCDPGVLPTLSLCPSLEVFYSASALSEALTLSLSVSLPCRAR